MSSCGCGNRLCHTCFPCAVDVPPIPFVSPESVPSQIENLVLNMFGTITKSLSGGRVIWTLPCNPSTSGISGVVREDDEGLVCYLLRIISTLGLVAGLWQDDQVYSEGTIVSDGSSLYKALKDVPVAIPLTDTEYWQIILTVALTYNLSTLSIAVDTTITDIPYSGQNVYLFNVTGNATVVVNLPQISTLEIGRWLDFICVGLTGSLTIVPFAGDRINGSTSPFIFYAAGESLSLIVQNSLNLRIR